MTNFKVEYRGFPVPENLLTAGSLFSGGINAWKRGVDDVLDTVRDTPALEKVKYFQSPTDPELYRRIREDESVEAFITTYGHIFESVGSASGTRTTMTPVSRESVPAAFRL
jgi:hypothetical protein